MVASLFAAFMSTIDTHVNLAASYFVNDLWRRFFVRDGTAAHYVLIARLSSVLVLLLGSVLGLYPFQQATHPDLVTKDGVKGVEALLAGTSLEARTEPPVTITSAPRSSAGRKWLTEATDGSASRARRL